MAFLLLGRNIYYEIVGVNRNPVAIRERERKLNFWNAWRWAIMGTIRSVYEA
jgi:hypothetical protein